MRLGHPAASVVIATYNRSNVLRYAIESVQAQTREDWELIVVGDAPTDDTRQVVEEFDDARIRYVELGWNVGDQSGPNNVGVHLAAGRFVALLNHDDLWWPDHLERGLAGLDGGADLVFSRLAVVDWVEPDERDQRLEARQSGGAYRPGRAIPASSWMFRPELWITVGPWRFGSQVPGSPSQDWLFRAWRSGARLEPTGHLTALALVSGTRPGVYARRVEEENRYYARRMVEDPDFRVAIEAATRRPADVLATLPGSRRFRHRAMMLASPVLARAGIDPYALRKRWQYGGRGGMIAELRRRRGLADERVGPT